MTDENQDKKQKTSSQENLAKDLREKLLSLGLKVIEIQDPITVQHIRYLLLRRIQRLLSKEQKEE